MLHPIDHDRGSRRQRSLPVDKSAGSAIPTQFTVPRLIRQRPPAERTILPLFGWSVPPLDQVVFGHFIAPVLQAYRIEGRLGVSSAVKSGKRPRGA